MSPVVSVIIPTYNREAVVEQTLKSVQDQTFADFEVVVVDDCSDDRTLEIVNAFVRHDSRFRLLRQDQNDGAPKCRNRGLAESTGRYVNFLDSDDLLHLEKLELQVALMEGSDADFVLCQVKRFSTSIPEGDMPDYGGLEPPIDLLSYLQNRVGWSTLAPLWRRKFLDRIGAFADDLVCFQDWELNARALAYEPRVEVVSEVGGYYRHDWSGTQITRERGKQTKRQALGMFASRRRLHEQLNDLDRMSDDVQREMKSHWLGAVRGCFRNRMYLNSLQSGLYGVRACRSMMERLRFVRSAFRTVFSG